jgi:hypothetical protein
LTDCAAWDIQSLALVLFHAAYTGEEIEERHEGTPALMGHGVPWGVAPGSYVVEYTSIDVRTTRDESHFVVLRFQRI